MKAKDLNNKIQITMTHEDAEKIVVVLERIVILSELDVAALYKRDLKAASKLYCLLGKYTQSDK